MPTEKEFRLWIKSLLRFQMIEIRVGTGWMREGIYLRKTAVSIERISVLPVRGACYFRLRVEVRIGEGEICPKL
jgi:hypothetical protein